MTKQKIQIITKQKIQIIVRGVVSRKVNRELLRDLTDRLVNCVGIETRSIEIAEVKDAILYQKRNP